MLKFHKLKILQRCLKYDDLLHKVGGVSQTRSLEVMQLPDVGGGGVLALSDADFRFSAFLDKSKGSPFGSSKCF